MSFTKNDVERNVTGFLKPWWLPSQFTLHIPTWDGPTYELTMAEYMHQHYRQVWAEENGASYSIQQATVIFEDENEEALFFVKHPECRKAGDA